MDDLISLGETLQQASSALVGDDLPDPDDSRSSSASSSPVIQLVVLGAPPTAEGGATRFPVLVDLQRDPNLGVGSIRASLGPRANMRKPSEVRQALVADMAQAKSKSRNRQEAHLILRSPIAGLSQDCLCSLFTLHLQLAFHTTSYHPSCFLLKPLHVSFPRPSMRMGVSPTLPPLQLQDNVSNQEAIILVVISATRVKDSLKLLRLAHDIDRDGARSIGVITQFERVVSDKAAAKLALELLQGQGAAMAQDYPWVPVLGQPLGDANTDAPMDEAWQGEQKALASVMRALGVKGMEGSMGRDALLRMIARTMRSKMKEKIPRIMAGLESCSVDVESELLRLGDSLISDTAGLSSWSQLLLFTHSFMPLSHTTISPPHSLESRSVDVESELLRLGESLISDLQGSRAVALELCRGFETRFIEHLDGCEGGGSQMVEKFVGTLPLRFRGLPLDEMFNFDNVKKVVAEADGYQPYVISPEKGLRLLIKRSLNLAKQPGLDCVDEVRNGSQGRLCERCDPGEMRCLPRSSSAIKRSLNLAKQPGLDCVDEVHKILLDIVVAAASTAPSLVRFPPMKKELVAIASAALDEYRAEAKVMEMVFIPALHTPFFPCFYLSIAAGCNRVSSVGRLVAIASAALDEYRAEAKVMVMALVDMERLVAIASAALDEYRAEAKVMVTALVDMERVFIPATHFIEAEYKRQETLFKEMTNARKSASRAVRKGGWESYEESRVHGK
ncbi:unnamed protein product [Closterium sp. NIES-65]|nr:unnamed protein product [Closterium sp. NIES-65]